MRHCGAKPPEHQAKSALIFVVVVSVVAGIAALGAPAQATTLSFNLDLVFSGDSPEGPAPWLRATFDDQAGAGWVRLTLEALLVESEFVTEWDFNFNPALDPRNLDIQQVSGPVPRSIRTDFDAFKADGDGFFDIEFRLESRAGARFGAGDIAVFDIFLGEGAIVAPDFDFGSVGGDKGSFRSAAHVQAIGAADDSGWIGARDGEQQVTEPGALALLGAGLLALALGRRKL